MLCAIIFWQDGRGPEIQVGHCVLNSRYNQNNLTHVCGSRVASLSQTAHRVSTFRKNIYIHSYDFQPSGFTWAVNHCRCWWTLKLKTPSNVEIPVSVASILGRSRSFLSWAIAAGLRQSGPGPKNRGPPSKPFVFLHFLKFPSYNL